MTLALWSKANSNLHHFREHLGADFILNSLERLHPKFFPVPVKAMETNRRLNSEKPFFLAACASAHQ